jgi:hypothetical protein
MVRPMSKSGPKMAQKWFIGVMVKTVGLTKGAQNKKMPFPLTLVVLILEDLKLAQIPRTQCRSSKR